LGQHLNKDLSYFEKTGFFGEKKFALKLLKEADEILTSASVDHCIMFGTLLGLLRHGDFIPWDDDLDIIVFDIPKFKEQCLARFESKGYTVLPDIRQGQSCGFRIYSEQGLDIPEVAWKFPWIGIWETVVDQDSMTLPPEKFVYNRSDFFPLQRRSFMGFSTMIPKNPKEILDMYLGTDDWMDFCIPSTLDHRQYRSTGFPVIKRSLSEVLEYLSIDRP
jgi:hypothetical protein